ncbi:hypothetical protein [Larkinella knui]
MNLKKQPLELKLPDQTPDSIAIYSMKTNNEYLTKLIVALFTVIGISLGILSCDSSSKKENYQLSRRDTNTVLQTVINAYKPRFNKTYVGQPMRILPNRYIKPGTRLHINGYAVTYSEVDSSKLAPRYSNPLFFATIDELRFDTDSTAYLDISFRHVGDGGEFWLIRKPKKGWIVIKNQFYQI